MNNENPNNLTTDDITEQKLQELSRRGLNTMTHGTWNKVRNAPLIGAAARRGEEKVAQKLGNNRLARKMANPINHQRINLGVQSSEQKTRANNPKNSDVGSRNLQNSLANKARNLLNIKNNKTKKNNNSSNNGNDSSENNDSSNSSLTSSDIFGSAKVRLKIKIIIYSVIIMIILLIVLAFLMVVFGIDISTTIPAISPNTYGTNNFQATYDEGTAEYKNEIKYYEKLKEVSKSYAASHGEELKTNYIHSLLIYIYYQVDMGEVSEKGDDIPINYSKMTEMVDTVVSLMTPANSSKNIDYEKNGEFYNNLKNSSDIKNYYSKLLQEKDIDSVLNEVFDLAKGLDDITYKDDTVITSETTVTVTNPSQQGSTNQPTVKMSVNEYISSSIYANSSFSNTELIKAYTIAYSTNLASENKNLTVDTNAALASNSLCSVTNGCSYDSNGNLVSGAGVQSNRNTIFYNGGYYYKKPLTSTEIADINKTINSVFGNILVNSDGTYPTLDITKLNNQQSGTYQDILKNAYGNDTLKNIGEDSYILDGSYGTQKVLTSVIFYDQNDYTAYTFCGKSKETIKTSGCGVTSMAIIVSTYENNKKYDPVMMMGEAHKTGYCGGSIVGTSPGFFKKEATTMKYKYYHASKYNKKDLNLVLQHLSQNHLVIAHMGPGHFTGGGHYIVLGGVDPDTKKVYVYDPNHKSNSSWRKTGNGWYSFNDIIVKETWGFYVIWKG